MKIVIIGAGIGGLSAAKYLSEGGADVTVYEAVSRENICYDWLDDVEMKVFDELDIPLPDGYFHTDNVSFGVPFSDLLLKVDVPEEKRDWSIERRPLSNILIDRAIAAGAKIVFETPVDSLLFGDGGVSGVCVGGQSVTADLVIDSSGVLSKFRASLPVEYGITPMPKKEEIFKVYRAFYAPREGVEPPDVHKKKIFLKHLGEDGISWCIVEPNGDVNVLVGRIGELSDDTLQNALAELKKDNPIIGDTILRGNRVCTIPVRYALPKMVCDGYAAIGDCAFQTIPLIGSGIANSLRAGKLLAEVILSKKAFDTASLWEYNYRYYKDIAAGGVSVDAIKRMLLSADGQGVRFLFESGVISQMELQSIADGAKLTMSPAQIFDKIKRGFKRLGLLISLASAISKGEKAEAHAGNVPSVYDEAAVKRWQSKLDKFFE